MTQPEQPETIQLGDVRRFTLRPGDRLAVIAPPEIDTPQKLAWFRSAVNGHVDVPVVVFPHGTDLGVVSPRQGHEPPCPCPLCTDDPAVEARTIRYPAPLSRSEQ